MASKQVKVVLTAAVDQYKQAMAQATQSTTKFGQSTLDSAMKHRAAWSTISIASGAAAFAMKAMFDDFDRGADALRVATGETGAALGKLQDSMGSVAGTVTQRVGDVGVAMGELAKRTDQTGEPLEALTKRFLDLERITGEATTTTIPAVTRLFGDWSIATEDQAGAMDKLFLASQNTGVGFGTLAELMVQFGSPLRQLGIDFDEAAAMFAKFESEGVNIQTTLPGLRMALKNFALAGREPAEALQETILAIQNAGSTAEANQLAFETFGVRAGPDLAAAIREGRFELGDLITAMNSGSDSIAAAAEDTLDLGDKLAMMRNELVMALGPFGQIGALAGGAVASIGPLLFGLASLRNAFKGSALASSRFGTAVKGAAGPIGVLTLAAGLAVTGIMAAKERAAQLQAAIEELSQGVLDGSQTWAQWRADLHAAVQAQDINDASLLEMISTQAAEIEATARSRVEMVHRRQELEAGTITEEQYTEAAKRHGLTEEQVAANIAAVKKAIAAANDETDKGTGSTTSYTEALDSLKAEAEDTAVAADLLTAALNALAGTALGAEESELAWLNSLAALRDELGHGTKTLDINTQAGRDNRQAILDSIDAAMARGASVAAETGSVEKGSRATERRIGTLIDEAARLGISRGAIKDYVDQLNLTPKEIKTWIEANIDPAMEDLNRLQSKLLTMANTVTSLAVNIDWFGTSPPGGPHQTPHAGGVIGASGARRLHAGGSLRGDEEMVIGQRGEHMMTARRYAQLTSMRGESAASPRTSRVLVIERRGGAPTISLDRRKFVDESDHEQQYNGRWA